MCCVIIQQRRHRLHLFKEAHRPAQTNEVPFSRLVFQAKTLQLHLFFIFFTVSGSLFCLFQSCQLLRLTNGHHFSPSQCAASRLTSTRQPGVPQNDPTAPPHLLYASQFVTKHNTMKHIFIEAHSPCITSTEMLQIHMNILSVIGKQTVLIELFSSLFLRAFLHYITFTHSHTCIH